MSHDPRHRYGRALAPDMLTTINWNSTLQWKVPSTHRIKQWDAFPPSFASGMVVTEKLLASADSSLGLPKNSRGHARNRNPDRRGCGLRGFLFPGAHVDVLMTSSCHCWAYECRQLSKLSIVIEDCRARDVECWQPVSRLCPILPASRRQYPL